MEEKLNGSLPEEKVEANINNDSTEECGSNNNNTTTRKTIDNVIDWTANAVSAMVRSGDAKETRILVANVLRTVFLFNSLGEYEIGVRIKGELYRFNDYQVPTGVSTLITAPKVSVNDVSTAVNFCDNKQFAASGIILTPGELIRDCKKVAMNLRTNPNFQAVSRPPFETLSNAAKYAVAGGKTEDTTCTKLYFLKVKCDEEQDLPLKEWAVRIAPKLFM